MDTVNETLPPTDPPPPPPQEPAKRLIRSNDDKVVAGLAGGLGRYFGIDPVVFRIAFVVLTLAGGSGILLYLVGWLLIPDDSGASPLPAFGSERNSKLVAAVLAGCGLLLLFDDLFGGDDDIPFGLVLVGLGALYLWSRRDKGDGGGLPTGDVEPRPTPPAVTSSEAEVAPKPRSAVVPVTLSLLAVLAGVLTLAGVSAVTGLALALLLTGGALIVGAWRGRARWLIPVGLVLAAALALVSVVDVPIRGGAGDPRFAPVVLEEVASPYRLAAGELVLDLADLDLRGQTVRIVASVAAGSLQVVVPADVALELDAHVGAGEMDVLGRQSDGLDVGRTVVESGREDAGRLVLKTRVGMGEVEVRRAAA